MATRVEGACHAIDRPIVEMVEEFRGIGRGGGSRRITVPVVASALSSPLYPEWTGPTGTP